MTDRAKKLESVKREIRSVLLTYPSGLTVPALLSDYRQLLGQNLPFKEFGYTAVDEFLRSIPDVVSTHWSSRHNTYLLKAVADETTKHIEKLVSKQKSSKSASVATRRMLSAVPSRRMLSAVPPRFSRSHNTKSASRPYLPVSVKNEIYQVAKEFKSGLSLSNFMTVFRTKYGKEFIYKNYGFYTLEDCLNTIPEIFLRCESGEIRVYPIIEKKVQENNTAVYSDSWKPVQVTNNNHSNYNGDQPVTCTSLTDKASLITSGDKPTQTKTMDALDNFSYEDEHADNCGIGSILREQFKQIMKNNPQGIWVSQFPRALKEFTGHDLDNHSKLGYYNLVDVFNDLPEIFRIEVVDGCKDDWMLYDATNPEENFKPKKSSEIRPPSVTEISKDCFEVIRNVRLLLQASFEGVSFDDFSSLYAANCGEQLRLNELGFDSLAVFLDTIAEKVPLTIDCSGAKPKVHYKKEETSGAPTGSVNPLLELPTSDVPPDAVLQCTEYKLQKIPGQNPDPFFPVYLSAAVDPSLMYIRLRGEDTSVLLENLMNELERFYYSSESALYRIPEHHIMSGIVCAAMWPSDNRWHRIRICGIPSHSSVVAFFVDYGTKERIPSDNLKFLKKKFMELPAQAIRFHLCRLKPCGDTWDQRAKDDIVNFFGRKPLMACLAEKPDGKESLPLVLCDTTGKDDIYLNDLLVSVGYARYATNEQSFADQEEASTHDSISRPEESISPPSTKKPEIMPVKQQESVPAGDLPGNLVHILSLLSTPAVASSDVQNLNNQIFDISNNFTNGNPAAVHSVAINQLQALGINGNMLSRPVTSSPNQPTAKNPGPNISPLSIGAHGQSVLPDPQKSHESDSEIFESDDDDNPEVNSISKRYVKRINLDDGYDHVHMIVIDERSYMSSGDITFLLWSHEDPNFVRRKLKSKEISIPNNTVYEVGYEQLFYQLERFQVKGVKSEVTGKSYITLFAFKNVIDILNIFGHPSVAVREIIDDELMHFDPSGSFWKTIAEEEFEDTPVSMPVTSDMEKKVNLYELKASFQALKFRKQILKNQLYSSANIPSLGDEIERIEAQSSEVERQIRELQIKVVSYQRERRFD